MTTPKAKPEGAAGKRIRGAGEQWNFATRQSSESCFKSTGTYI